MVLPTGPTASAMANYQIICTSRQTGGPITHVGVTNRGSTTHRIWTICQVEDAMAQGDRFHVIGADSRLRVEVETVECSSCRHLILRTNPDSRADNNLENLPTC